MKDRVSKDLDRVIFKHGMVKEVSKFTIAGVHLSIQQIPTEYLLFARHTILEIKETKKERHGSHSEEPTGQQRSGRIWN